MFLSDGARITGLFLGAFLVWTIPSHSIAADVQTAGVRVGTGSAEFEADDDMIIAGGITAGKVQGQA